MEDIWVKLYDRDGPLGHKRPASTLLFVFFRRETSLFTATLRTRKEFLPCQGLSWPGGRTIGALRAERQILTSANGTSCSARHELSSRAFLFIVYCFCGVRATHKCLAFCKFCENFGQCPSPSLSTPHLLCLRNARAFPLLPAALASVSFGFVLVRWHLEFDLFEYDRGVVRYEYPSLWIWSTPLFFILELHVDPSLD